MNYRSAQYLNGALASLFSFEQEGDFFEVIVVNNDPLESEALRLLKQAFPFFLIESGGNVGFGRGNNLGAKKARGKILAFINPDVLWTGMHLRSIAAVFAEQQMIGILGMALLNADKEPEAWSAGREPSLLNLLRNNVLPEKQALWQRPELFFPDWVSGGGLCIRQALFSAIGGFDERYFLYFEDVDLCAAARQRGFSVARHTAFPLLHLGGKSQHSTRSQKKHFYASQRQYFAKHRPRWEWMILSWLQALFHKRYV
mgnify:CR=1 FL=1